MLRFRLTLLKASCFPNVGRQAELGAKVRVESYSPILGER